MARLYHLVVEQTGPGVTVYHAVQEEGVPLRDIAEILGKGLHVTVVSLDKEKAAEHFVRGTSSFWFAEYLTQH